MEEERLAELLGQDEIADRLAERLREPGVRLARLTGGAGSGKSYVARRIASSWLEAGERCVVAVGDDKHSWRELFPLLSGLSRAPRDWAGLASTGSRAAVRYADAAAGGAGMGVSVFDMLTGAFRQEAERALKPYSADERDVLLDLRRLARKHRLLLIADNAHWWDAVSLRLLADIASEPLCEAVPQLGSVTVLLVDTASEQVLAAPEEFETLVTRYAAHTETLSRCSREQFPRVLELFEMGERLPERVLDELFVATDGHLTIAQQIAAEGGADVAPVAPIFDEEYIAALFSKRFASLGSFSPDVTDVLVRAAVLGLSFTAQDLGCLSDLEQAEVQTLLSQAERINFVKRSNGQVEFGHEVIRSAILSKQESARVTELHLKRARCLARLRPGDYDARAQALLQGGDRERAREMVALAGVAQIRRGVPLARALHRAETQFPDDQDLVAFLEVIAAGYRAVAGGDFASERPNLRVPLPNETTAMAAERNYLAAIFSLGLQTIAGADDARLVLSAWASKLRSEIELQLRFYVLLQQAQVLSERFDEARATEVLLEQKLSSRAPYDADAAAMIQIQNRRAGGIVEPQAAARQIRASVKFFRRGSGDPLRDSLELFRSLTNLSAIEIRLDRNEDAYGHALEAEEIAVEALDVGHRLDVLASNLVLAGQRSGALSLAEAIERQLLVVNRPAEFEDNFIERCNLASYYLLDGRDEDAEREIARLDRQKDEEEIDETYLVYYSSALGVALAVVLGDVEEAMRRHRQMEKFVKSLRWPSSPYVRRRHRLLGDLIPGLDPKLPRFALDMALVLDAGDGAGPAWTYYGRLFPCCELSFWADS